MNSTSLPYESTGLPAGINISLTQVKPGRRYIIISTLLSLPGNPTELFVTTVI
jgi:hypothetical protein